MLDSSIRLIGKQVYLRPITASKEDTGNIIRWRNSKGVRPYFIYRKPFTVEGHTKWLEEVIIPEKGHQFIVCKKEDHKPIGSIFFRDIDPENRTAEQGLFLGEEQEKGKGIGCEMLTLLSNYGFETLRFHKISARVLAENTASLQCHLKAGFVQEGLFKEQVLIDGQFKDVVWLARYNPAERERKENGKKKISFVIPCYCSARTIESVVKEIREAMEKLPKYEYEVVLVNDCSLDDTFQVIKEICQRNSNICGLDLAKNFGQHGALMAGFRQVTGDIVVCLDDDGQTPAAEVDKLLKKIEEGEDVVYASYANKKHSLFRNFGTFMNEKMAEFLLGKPRNLCVSSYFAARRFVVEEMMKYENAYPYVIGLVLRTTKRIANVEVDHRERQTGQSGYNFKKLLALWFNGFTAFSTKPLRIATVSGSLFALAGFAYGIYTVVKKFLVPQVPIGFSSLMSALMFIGGMVLLMMGLIGEYIGRMYICMNKAPQFVVRETVGKEVEIKQLKMDYVGKDRKWIKE